LSYVVAAWFAYLQASPGLVLPRLRAELDLSYTAGGLHVAAFAAGSAAAGLISARLERTFGRRTLLRSAAILMGAGVTGLTAAEWCVSAWGASFTTDAASVSTDTGVALMVGYFGGVLVLAPVTVGTLADTTSLQAALIVVPIMLILGAAGLALMSRVRRLSTESVS
jgi:fucose permease